MGKGVVVLYKSDYSTGLRKIIDDSTKFKPLENDPTSQREAMLQRFLRKHKTNGHLNDVTNSNIYRTGSQPARIYGLPKMHGKYMVSFDVESLFTNIPLKESIDLAVEYIFKGIPDIKIAHDHLKKLFFIATSQMHFLFDGSFYDQIDGVAMWSPLAPVLANPFMGHHEMKWLDFRELYSLLLLKHYMYHLSSC